MKDNLKDFLLSVGKVAVGMAIGLWIGNKINAAWTKKASAPSTTAPADDDGN